MAQVNLLRHQRTDLPPSKNKWKQHSHKYRSKSQKRYSNEHKNQRPLFQKFDLSQALKKKRYMLKVIQSLLKVSIVLLGSSSPRPAVNMIILQACATKSNPLLSQEIPRYINCKQDVFTYKKIQYATSQVI